MWSSQPGGGTLKIPTAAANPSRKGYIVATAVAAAAAGRLASESIAHQALQQAFTAEAVAVVAVRRAGLFAAAGAAR